MPDHPPHLVAIADQTGALLNDLVTDTDRHIRLDGPFPTGRWLAARLHAMTVGELVRLAGAAILALAHERNHR